jgi:hypothetical protein
MWFCVHWGLGHGAEAGCHRAAAPGACLEGCHVVLCALATERKREGRLSNCSTRCVLERLSCGFVCIGHGAEAGGHRTAAPGACLRGCHVVLCATGPWPRSGIGRGGYRTAAPGACLRGCHVVLCALGSGSMLRSRCEKGKGIEIE